MKIKITTALLLLYTLLLSSCTTSGSLTTIPPTSSPPTSAIASTQPTFISDNIITKKIFTPHSFEVTFAAEKINYSRGDTVVVLITVKNIGEDYTIPSADAFSSPNLFFRGSKYASMSIVMSGELSGESSPKLDTGNVLPKGKAITQKFTVSTDQTLDVCTYDFVFMLFGEKVIFSRAVTVFNDPDISFEALYIMSKKAMLAYYIKSEKVLEDYRISIRKLNEGSFLVSYMLYIGKYEAGQISFTLTPDPGLVTTQSTTANNYNYFAGTVSQNMMDNAEINLLKKINDYIAENSDSPIFDIDERFYLDLDNGTLRLKATIALSGQSGITFSEIIDVDPDYETWDKPVIYLYPEVPTDVSVKLDVNGKLTFTYPAYTDGWKVTAYPDGTLVDRATGKEYSYLFWESRMNIEFDLSEGFVVKGEDTAEFLQDTLSKMGLTPREYNEMIVYWLPKMQNNEYNLITFQQEAYTDNARLQIDPEPDSMLRVFMAFKALEEPIEVKEPALETFERKGFAVVEWGGTEIKS